LKTTLGLYVLEGVEVAGGTTVSPLHPHTDLTWVEGPRGGEGDLARNEGGRGPGKGLRPVPRNHLVRSGAVGGGTHVVVTALGGSGHDCAPSTLCRHFQLRHTPGYMMNTSLGHLRWIRCWWTGTRYITGTAFILLR
jgi:hypothetical protein